MLDLGVRGCWPHLTPRFVTLQRPISCIYCASVYMHDTWVMIINNSHTNKMSQSRRHSLDCRGNVTIAQPVMLHEGLVLASATSAAVKSERCAWALCEQKRIHAA